jgi:hypothetical protein
MPSQPIPDQDRLDVGGGVAATRYYDGSIVFWKIAPPNEQVGYLPPNAAEPVDLQNGQAATVAPDGSIMVYPIDNPPPEVAGQVPGGAAPAQPTAPTAPASPRGANNPITPGGYGSRGFLPSGEPRPTNLLQGTTDFGRGPTVDIRPEYADPLKNKALAPGYLEGSGTYNQYRLDQGGLFGTIPGQSGVVNLRYGLGGTGDPTNGSEVQTPQRYITGNAADSTVAQQGDEAWRRRRGGGGGGYLYQDGRSQGAGYRYPQSAQVVGYTDQPVMPGMGVGGGGDGYDEYGMGGGSMFGSNRQANWGQGDQAGTGLDYIATLFLRPDTPTGINTAAWSAPPQMWEGLIAQIRAGNIYVKDPIAWQMISEALHRPVTPQSVGGAATGGQNVQPGGAAGGSSTEDAIANGNAAEAADRAAYWAYQQSLLRQGDTRIAMEAARDAWTKAYQEAGLTGMYAGQPTLAAQQQQAALTGFYQGSPTLAREQWMDSKEYRDAQAKLSQQLAEAGLLGTYQGQATLAKLAQEFQQAEMNRQFGLTEAGVTGTYNGAPTMAAINQQNQTALSLMQLQSSLRGPRNWDAYQSTFNSTPQGLKDVVGAFQGRYTLPGATGAQQQAQGGRATVAGLAGDLLSGTYGSGQQGQQPESLTNPYQADMRNWSRMQPSQREMILGKYENQGWYGDDFLNTLNSAAPKYAGAQQGSYNLFQS